MLTSDPQRVGNDGNRWHDQHEDGLGVSDWVASGSRKRPTSGDRYPAGVYPLTLRVYLLRIRLESLVKLGW